MSFWRYMTHFPLQTWIPQSSRPRFPIYIGQPIPLGDVPSCRAGHLSRGCPSGKIGSSSARGPKTTKRIPSSSTRRQCVTALGPLVRQSKHLRMFGHSPWMQPAKVHRRYTASSDAFGDGIVVHSFNFVIAWRKSGRVQRASTATRHVTIAGCIYGFLRLMTAADTRLPVVEIVAEC